MPNLPMLHIPLNPEFYGDEKLNEIVDGLIDTLVELIAPGAPRATQSASHN